MVAVIGVIIVLALAVGTVAFVLAGDGGGDKEVASTGTTFGLGEGEIFLEPANAEGPEAFTGEIFVEDVDTEEMIPPPDTPTPSTDAGAATAVSTSGGDTPGLYGGTRDSSRCDPDQVAEFLADNPDKAKAWVEALNSDPTLLWSGGDEVTVTDVDDYIAELTPLTLVSDTRVTNYGYRNGRPTPRQSVLERGTAVLVDAYGVPRVKCNCGNPLTRPTPVQTRPAYTGDRWDTFEPTQVIVVTETTVVIDVFVVVDIYTGDEFDRPTGTTGDEDEDVLPSSLSISVNGTLVPDPTQASDATATLTWEGTFEVDDTGGITGTGSGTISLQGGCYEGETLLSSATVDGAYDVTISGTATDEPAYLVSASPGGVSVTNVDIPGDTTGVCTSQGEQIVNELAGAGFGDLGTLVEGSNPFSLGGYSGDITLTAL